MPKQTLHLTVGSAQYQDIYKDTARITADDRGALETGRVYSFKVDGRSARLIVRRSAAKDSGKLLIDKDVRQRLGVAYGQSYSFEVSELGFFQELWWGWNASEPTFRSMSRVAAISLGLGALSFLLGAFSLVIALSK